LSAVILLTSFRGENLSRLKRAFGPGVHFHVVETIKDLSVVKIDEATTLISFGTGVIVPRDILLKLRRPAYNLHAASPAFPGRDPHHHAIYRGAKSYGATLHIMEEKVDSGQIVGVELFDIKDDSTPQSLLAQANEAGLRLIEKTGHRLLSVEPLSSISGVKWGEFKTRRIDLLRMAELSPLVTKDEFERRFLAFDGGPHDNLTLRLHGKTFRIDKANSTGLAGQNDFYAFTETAFRHLLVALREGRYRFARYGERPEGRHVLWRHDVDFSMHRAAKLAAIEAEEGAIATYFVNARSSFYNLLEPKVLGLCRSLREMGHDIGLHFDAGAYGTDYWQRSTLEAAVSREQRLLESILDMPIRSLSWHNPDMSNLLEFDDETIAGLQNAYAGSLKRDYTYCSDSNGYWRFQPMADVIAKGSERLHLLTHPAWWTPDAMSPSERIDRAILGRARATRRDYDALLKAAGRKNVTS
jgi:methionyl-tRNA formyltransferase